MITRRHRHHLLARTAMPPWPWLQVMPATYGPFYLTLFQVHIPITVITTLPAANGRLISASLATAHTTTHPYHA